MVDRDDAQVNYSVKELLSNIRTEQTKGFARLETAMSGKADKADVARLEARLDSHQQKIEAQDNRLATVEQRQRDEAIGHEWWSTRLAKVGAFIVGLMYVTAVVISVIHAVA